MDPTVQAAVAALAGTLVGAGGVVAYLVSERQQHRRPEPEEPAISPEVATVLSTLRSSAVVVDVDDVVVKASAPAYALGLVRDDALLVPELSRLVREVRRDGQIREEEMVLERDLAAPLTVHARVAPLGSKLVLALLEDRSRERRVEAVRRDFVANVSHELKTPVGAIRILAEAVEEASDDPEAVRRFAGRMLNESERLAGLVQQVIDLSRLQSSDPADSGEEVAVDTVVAEALDAAALDAEQRGIRLVARGVRGVRVRGDRALVTAAVSNLVANAVAYSDEGTTVLVETRTENRTVEISVVDQGIGIPPREVDRIFERFYRVDPARHRSTGGTGLGLSIVKHAAATLGGDVRVWSVEGEGSTFTLVLPRIVDHPLPPPVWDRTDRPGDDPGDDPGGDPGDDPGDDPSDQDAPRRGTAQEGTT